MKKQFLFLLCLNVYSLLPAQPLGTDTFQLDNSNFNEWHIEDRLYCPWTENTDGYWDTINPFTTLIGSSNSTFVDEGNRRFANLESKYVIIKFCAGVIYTGQFIEADGTNFVLSLGRPFVKSPSKMCFEYKYHTSTINRTVDWTDAYVRYINRDFFEGLKGQPDSCHIIIALGRWEPEKYETREGQEVECPYIIRTRPSKLHLFDKRNSHIIAYAEMTCGDNVTAWTNDTLTLNYRTTDQQPQFIIVYATSSKYGNFNTGSEGAVLQLDNIELLYDIDNPIQVPIGHVKSGENHSSIVLDYDLRGNILFKPARGMNIFRLRNGSKKKVLIK